MVWLTQNFPLILGIAIGILSEVLAIVQQLKYPLNSGFGGVIASLLKVLQALGSKAPSA